MNDSHTQPVAVEQADALLVADILELASNLKIAGNDLAAIRNGIWNEEPSDLGRLLTIAARHRLAERARLTTDRSLGAEAAISMVRDMLAGYDGQPNLMGDVYKILDATLAATPPVPAISEPQMVMWSGGAEAPSDYAEGKRVTWLSGRQWQPGDPAPSDWRYVTSYTRVPANSGEGEKLREAIRRALHCTPSISTAGYHEARIVYDCGDPWEILREALATPDAAPIGSVDADYSGYVEEGDA